MRFSFEVSWTLVVILCWFGFIFPVAIHFMTLPETQRRSQTDLLNT